MANTKTPSTRTVLKTLREGGFPMDAIIDQGRGTVEIGYITEGRVALDDTVRTRAAADLASTLLGEQWGWWGTGYGSTVVEFNYKVNELAFLNIDQIIEAMRGGEKSQPSMAPTIGVGRNKTMTKNQNMKAGERLETHINSLPETRLPLWNFVVEGWELSDYSREPKSQNTVYELTVDATRNDADGFSNVIHNHYFTNSEAAKQAEQDHHMRWEYRND